MKKIFLVCFLAISNLLSNMNSHILVIAGNDSHEIIESSNFNLIDHKPSIEENFKDDRIIVTLKKEYSKINQRIDLNLFETNVFLNSNNLYNVFDRKGKILFESIDDLSYLTNFSDTVDSNEYNEYYQIFSINLKNKSKSNVLKAIEELNKLDFVLSAEPEYNYSMSFSEIVCNDTYYDRQWGLNDTNGANIASTWNLIGMGDASPKIKVGIIEGGGVQNNHPDLNIIAGNYTPASNGNPSHGTKVAGIIGAISNNIGVVGVAQVEIALVDGNYNNLASTLTYAIDNNIKIINASFHYADEDGNPAPASTAHLAAISNYGLYGGIIVAAAGNYNNNIDNSPIFPAGYANQIEFPSINNVISVGAHNTEDRCDFSNYGTNSVDIYAPGQSILTTFPESIYNQYVETHVSVGYGIANGTSMAAPFVSGVAALLKSYKPSLSASQIKSAIVNYADTYTITLPDESTQSAKKLNALNSLLSIHDHDYIDNTCRFCGICEEHNYTSYGYINGIYHKVICDCGAFINEYHVVLSTTSSTCILCNGRVEHGLVEININSSQVRMITSNGSYILPNGVIILVYEDLKAYLNGTLVFYDKNLVAE